MSQGQSRRQWLLGMVGGLFGAAAAGAVERALPAEPAEPAGPPQPAQLSFTRGAEGGEAWSWRTVGEGKVLIEYDTATGRLALSITDREGKVLERFDQGLQSVSLRRQSAEGDPPGPRTTFVYDCSGELVNIVGSNGSVATFVYDSSKPPRPSA